MDFKSKIIEAIVAAEKEIEQLVTKYETTIKNQKKEIEQQRNEIQELRKKLKTSEGNNLLLQVRLDLEAAKELKKSSSKNVQPKAKEQIRTEIAQVKAQKSSEEDVWEKTLLQVRNNLSVATEKNKREKSYYEHSSSTDLSSTTDLDVLNDSLKPAIYQYKVNVVDKSVLETFIKKYNLVERKAILPLYETRNSHEIYLYTEVETIFIDLLLKEIYMIKEEFEKLSARYSPLVLKHRQIANVKTTVREEKNFEKVVIQRSPVDFKQTANHTLKEDSLFSEQSELNKLGYRISGSTREERWKALRRAIPVLGLKKVVNIISANVRIRKRQKNGEQKYQYAIAEWEHDLSQLKEKYYYDGFKWPNT